MNIEFEISITYPTTTPDIAAPGLDRKTAKMYRSGKIGLTNHFKTVWARNVAKFGLAHPPALGLGMCLAVEGPDLIPKSVSTKRKSSNEGSSHQGGQRNFG